MAIAVPNWAYHNSILINMTPQVRSSGSWADDTFGVIPFFGRWETFNFRWNSIDSQITPSGLWVANNVPTGAEFQLTVAEQVSAEGMITSSSKILPKGNALQRALSISLYHKIEILLLNSQLATPTQVGSILCYAKFQEWAREGGREKIGDSATFNSVTVIDPSTGLEVANPTFS